MSLSCRLLDDVETGGGDTQGHGMVLALHMLNQLKSSQKFSELLTKQYDSICCFLHCLHPIHKQLTVSICVCQKGRAACLILTLFPDCSTVCTYWHITILTDTLLSQTPSKSRSHLLPFMLPGAEESELGALYQHVRRVMVGVHQGREEVESLVHIADEW